MTHEHVSMIESDSRDERQEHFPKPLELKLRLEDSRLCPECDAVVEAVTPSEFRCAGDPVHQLVIEGQRLMLKIDPPRYKPFSM